MRGPGDLIIREHKHTHYTLYIIHYTLYIIDDVVTVTLRKSVSYVTNTLPCQNQFSGVVELTMSLLCNTQ